MRLRPGLGRKRIFAEFRAQETCVVAANVVPRWEQQTALQIFHLDYRGRGGREGKGESTGKGKEGKYGKNGRKTPSWIPEMNFRLEP